MRKFLEMSRGRKKQFDDTPIRVKDNPNFRRYRDTDYYASKQGDIYKAYKHTDRKMSIYMNTGHSCVKINGKKANPSRVVWECFNGEIPKGYYLIHKNKMKIDCALHNLKLVTAHQLSVYAGRMTPKKWC